MLVFLAHLVCNSTGLVFAHSFFFFYFGLGFFDFLCHYSVVTIFLLDVSWNFCWGVGLLCSSTVYPLFLKIRMLMLWYDACLCGVRLLTLKQQIKIKELLRWKGNEIQLLQILNFFHDWQKNTFDYCTALKFNIFTVYF